MTNEQDLIFRARFEDEASEDIQNLNEDIESTNKSMGGLGLGAVTAGLAMFGLGVGATQVSGKIQETAARIGQVDAKLAFLPAHVRDAMNKTDFSDLAVQVAATELEIREAFAGIANAAGGAIPTMDELKLAFDLARTTGVDLATAADAVGQALMGNLEPLNDLVDRSGKNFVSLNLAIKELGPIADDSITFIDHLTVGFRELGEELSRGDFSFIKESLDISPPQNVIDDWNAFWDAVTRGGFKKLGEELAGGDFSFIKESLDISPPQSVIDDWNAFWDAITRGGASDIPSDFGSPAVPGMDPADVPGAGAAAAADYYLGLGQRSIGITINGDVDTATRAATIARQIELQIRNIYRGGINTIVDTRMFPN